MSSQEDKPMIVFFGSGPVAAKSLELLANNFIVEAVVTKPKPASHKGAFPVLDLTEKLNLRVFPVTNRASLSELIKTKPFASQVGVLIDFGIILSQDVIDYFAKGIVNSHFSLLPEWRGADPITFSILSGQKKTGVSLMLLVEKMDEGPLLGQSLYEIKSAETTASLTEQLINLSNSALQLVLPLWLKNETRPAKQEDVTLASNKKPTYSRKLTKEDGRIDWKKPAQQLEREIRAFIDWPKSYTVLNGIDLTITQASISDQAGAPGQFLLKDKQLIVYCGQQALSIEKLKPAGKANMDINDFLNGYKDKLVT